MQILQTFLVQDRAVEELYLYVLGEDEVLMTREMKMTNDLMRALD